MEPAPPSSLPLQIQHLPEESTAVPETDKTAAQPPSAPSPISLTTVEGTNAAKPIIMKKTNKKTISLKPRPKPSSSDSSSSAASFSQYVSRRRGIRLFRASRSLKALSGPGRPKLANVGALALPLGMSIAAVVAQVLKGKDEVDKTISADHLSQICAGAVRESLVNVYGDQFDGFLENFERSFRSTLMTLNLINKCAKDNGAKENPEIGKCFSEVSTASSPDRSEHSARCSDKECWADQILQANTMFGQPRNREQLGESPLLDYRNTQLVLHDTEIEQQMSSVFPSRNTKEDNYKSILSTLEKSLEEQARSNDLMRFKMGLTMKKMQLKERQLALSENANLLERWKLSFGFSKASFKAEKFKTQLEETRYAELLRKCIDSLVAGLLVMLACVGYGAFLYSHKRITEATASCSTEKIHEETKSWFSGLNPMASFNSGLKILTCQFQVLTRMLAGGFMVLAIAYLLLQRSATSNQAMPVTFIVLLLAFACGFAGKLCIDTLGGSGNCWLLYWESLCCIHLFSNLWTSILFRILHGPLSVSEGKKIDPFVPYWIRRCLFYGTVGLLIPLLCGFLPFASVGEWKDHFALLIFSDLQ